MHGKPPSLTGNEHPNLVRYAIFPTRTDDIFIGVGNDGTCDALIKSGVVCGTERKRRARSGGRARQHLNLLSPLQRPEL
jgi:crotonobetainyl-CoA:carnitine CoA-transferase CaiB-like acyl-CoA transferase